MYYICDFVTCMVAGIDMHMNLCSSRPVYEHFDILKPNASNPGLDVNVCLFFLLMMQKRKMLLWTC